MEVLHDTFVYTINHSPAVEMWVRHLIYNTDLLPSLAAFKNYSLVLYLSEGIVQSKTKEPHF